MSLSRCNLFHTGEDLVRLGPTFNFALLAFLLVFVEAILLRMFDRALSGGEPRPSYTSQDRDWSTVSATAALGLLVVAIEVVVLVNTDLLASEPSNTVGMLRFRRFRAH